MKLRRARCEDAPALTALIYACKQANGYDDVSWSPARMSCA